MTDSYHAAYDLLAERLASATRSVALDGVKETLKQQEIETPSWAYGNSGTRFRVFPQPGVPRTPFEKMEDAAEVHRLTGVCPAVAIHIPWDKVDDFGELQAYARTLGVRIGAINPNVFQDEDYKFGSITHHDARVRRKAVDHMIECVEIGRQVGSNVLSLWFADGTNYAGQAHIRRRKRWMQEALAEVYARMPAGMRMLIEYKFFEPAFYHTDLADWGMAYTMSRLLGESAQVLVDLGHHAQGTNVEHIVAFLLDEGKLGGFHFNNRKYADDDLMVGSVNPFEMFLIYHELVDAEYDPRTQATARAVAYMIDQSHNVEGKVAGMIQSVMNIQTAYAKALLVDRACLRERQDAGDVVGAHAVLLDAYETDVRPLLAVMREEMGRPPDPLAAFMAGDYMARIAEARRGGVAMAWT
jgi:L-rhamnose isomerase/sugar isomerase